MSNSDSGITCCSCNVCWANGNGEVNSTPAGCCGGNETVLTDPLYDDMPVEGSDICEYGCMLVRVEQCKRCMVPKKCALFLAYKL